MEKILLSDIHIIACARGKTEWVLEDQNGKQVPKKVGMGATQDKDISFDYTVSFQLEQSTHNATADKDNTHLFDDIHVLTEKDGENLYDWANSGEAPAPRPKKPKIDIDKNEELIEIVQSKFTSAEKEIQDKIKGLLAEHDIPNFKDGSIIPTKLLEEIVNLLN